MRQMPVRAHPGLHNLFFAVLPPEDLAHRILDEVGCFSLGDEPLRFNRLHLTTVQLVRKAAIPKGWIEAAVKAAERVRWQPFPVQLDDLVAGEDSALLLPQEKLEAFALFREQLRFMIVQCGLGIPRDRRFSPHLTVGYRSAKRFQTQLDDPIIWTARDFALIDSHIGETRHELIGRWPLRA